ncbi:MAG TPA: hypothetical protein VMS30_05950 [Phycisphaerales bacterium]|nr:hypothetical protein [Phycisphaerales bacterium]
MPGMLASHEIRVQVGFMPLAGTLAAPVNASRLVIFAHGSGSSRHSPRNQAVAVELQQHGCATLLMDLLTEAESLDRNNVFDIDLLGTRVVEVARWIRSEGDPAIAHLPIGLFGASTGAAAALAAAAELDDEARAVVSRGGRPDLAGHDLPRVTAPTLLLVGSLDHEVLELNRQAQKQMRCENQLVVIHDATHLFEEPGTLEQVAQHAAGWFGEYMPAPAPQ